MSQKERKRSRVPLGLSTVTCSWGRLLVLGECPPLLLPPSPWAPGLKAGWSFVDLS